jgi:hypothetical protein
LFVTDEVEMVQRHARMLARLSELGLTLVERVHEQALAAEDAKSAAELGLAFHRISRTVRQTIALEAKLVRDAARAEREASAQVADLRKSVLRDPVRIVRRKAAVQEAVERIIWNEREGEEADYLLDLLEERLTIAGWDDDFGLEPLEDHIARLCADFGLPVPDGEPPDDDDDEDALEFDAAPEPARQVPALDST